MNESLDLVFESFHFQGMPRVGPLDWGTEVHPDTGCEKFEHICEAYPLPGA